MDDTSKRDLLILYKNHGKKNRTMVWDQRLWVLRHEKYTISIFWKLANLAIFFSSDKKTSKRCHNIIQIPRIWRNFANYNVPDFLKNFIWKTKITAKVVLISNLVGNQRIWSFLKHFNNKLIIRPHPKTSWSYHHDFILEKTRKSF